MSYGFMEGIKRYGFIGYIADIDALQAAAGSGDEALHSAICERLDLTPAVQRALAQIIRGEPKDKDEASSYGYAFELIVRHLGCYLDNSALSDCSPGYLEVADAALRAGGVTAISLEGLCLGALPVTLPTPSDVPGYGHLTAAQVIAADDQLTAFPDPADPYLRAAVQELRRWTREARAKHWGIVAFYY